jgi:transposase-like protein
MAGIDITVEEGLLSGLLSGDGSSMAQLMQSMLNQVIAAQADEAAGASRYERSEERAAYRSGTRVRTLYTRVGTLTLQVPQLRDGSFSTEIFKRYQRSEQAFVLAMMEMVVQGVSTRKVAAITEELCGIEVSKSTVSRLCEALEIRLKAFNERRLQARFPFVLIDAMYIKARGDERVQSKAVLIASGIDETGHRQILGLTIGDSESTSTWGDFFKTLKARGLSGVDWVISDDHEGLKAAVNRHLQGASWQRCQVHLMRNVMGHTPSKYKAPVAEACKLVLYSRNKAEAKIQLQAFVEQFASKAAKAVQCLEDGFEDATSVFALPEKYRKRLRTTNMQERLNEEIRRRERVIRIFPNEQSAMRLIGALLAETNERWSERLYLDMQDYWEWREAASGVVNTSAALEDRPAGRSSSLCAVG